MSSTPAEELVNQCGAQKATFNLNVGQQKPQESQELVGYKYHKHP